MITGTVDIPGTCVLYKCHMYKVLRITGAVRLYTRTHRYVVTISHLGYVVEVFSWVSPEQDPNVTQYFHTCPNSVWGRFNVVMHEPIRNASSCDVRRAVVLRRPAFS
jgi:hypothetical protein